MIHFVGIPDEHACRSHGERAVHVQVNAKDCSVLGVIKSSRRLLFLVTFGSAHFCVEIERLCGAVVLQRGHTELVVLVQQVLTDRCFLGIVGNHVVTLNATVHS